MQHHIITSDSVTATHIKRYIYIIDLEGCFKIYCQVNKASLYEKNWNNIKSHINKCTHTHKHTETYKRILKLLSLVTKKSRI